MIIVPELLSVSQGYILTIKEDGITLKAADRVGLFYGVMTLKQLIRQQHSRNTLSCMRIEDWPDFPVRGVMLDISRDRVPTMETLCCLIDILAEIKLNQVQLYTEHIFAYSRHKRVWEHASPLTGDEVEYIDQYCRDRGMELVANQNSFGHMDRWLGYDEYKHLAEAPDGFFDPWGKHRDLPNSLCPVEPKAIDFLSELYDELLRHFSSRLFNVGCDETFDLGQGRSRSICQEKGKGRVYLDFLLKIHQLVSKRGKKCSFGVILYCNILR